MSNKNTNSFGENFVQAFRADAVNHPAHYQHGGIETIDYIAAVTADMQGLEAVCVANAIKYISRFKKKNGKEDLQKAVWYLNKLISKFAVEKQE